MASYVGLDIGTRTITGVVLSRKAKSIRLEDFFVEEIPELTSVGDGPPTAETVDLEDGLPSSVGEVIRRVIQERKLQGRDVVAALDTKDCVIRDRITVPFTRDDQIRKTITFEAENHLITFDVEEMVLQHHKIGEQDGNSLLFLMAFHDAAVADRLEILKEGGVDPTALDLDSAALFNAFAMTPTFDRRRTTLLIDVGATSTKVVLVEDGVLKMLRSLRLGALLGARSPHQIAPSGASTSGPSGPDSREFELPDARSIEARFDEIESMLRRLDPAGAGPLGGVLGSADEGPIAILTDDEYAQVTDVDGAADGEVAVESEAAALETATLPVPASEAPRHDYKAFLHRLGLEIQRTFSTSLVAPIDLIVLTGGLSDSEETRRFFADEFDVETIVLDFGRTGDTFEMDLDEAGRAELNRVGAVAVGLALKELGKDGIGLDFRKKHFRYERRFEKLKLPLLCLAIMACALFLWTSFDRFSTFNLLNRQLEQIRLREREYYKAFFDEPYRGGDLVMPKIIGKNGQVEKLKGFLGKGSEIPSFLPEIDAIEELALVLKQAKKKGLDFEIKNAHMAFELRRKRGAGSRGRAKRGASSLTLADSKGWTLTLLANDRIGEEFRKLFNTSKMFTADPDERITGGKTQVILTLTVKDSFLKTLR